MQLFTAGQSMASSKSSKNSILKKKLQADKLALELKIVEEKCKQEILLIRTQAKWRAELLDLKKKAEESRLEYE